MNLHFYFLLVGEIAHIIWVSSSTMILFVHERDSMYHPACVFEDLKRQGNSALKICATEQIYGYEKKLWRKITRIRV
jgi:hypothetical protein